MLRFVQWLIDYSNRRTSITIITFVNSRQIFFLQAFVVPSVSGLPISYSSDGLRHYET